MVKFDIPTEDAQTVRQISERAVRQARESLQKTHGRVESSMVRMQDWMMDITAVHANGCPLRLRDLLLADDFNFAHDVFGIRRHLDRTTGQLGGHFLPRFSA